MYSSQLEASHYHKTNKVKECQDEQIQEITLSKQIGISKNNQIIEK